LAVLYNVVFVAEARSNYGDEDRIEVSEDKNEDHHRHALVLQIFQPQKRHQLIYDDRAEKVQSSHSGTNWKIIQLCAALKSLFVLITNLFFPLILCTICSSTQ